MPKFNDFDMNKWKELSDIETDSLWIIKERDKSGKNDGFYPKMPTCGESKSLLLARVKVLTFLHE